MRFLTNKALIFVCSAMCINCLCVNPAAADSATYVYRGNNFEELEGEPGVFSTKDRVTGHFTVDCSNAQVEGTCANLPYDNYFWLGAITFESVHFSAGPASLPTVDGHADVNAFWFSTDSNGQIVDWDIDLSLYNPSGIINVDTDTNVDSAAALGSFANVPDNPGKWKKVGRPGKRPTSVFRDHNRIYGNSVMADVCVDAPPRNRCAFLHAWEDYDMQGTFQFTGIYIDYWFSRLRDDGSYVEWWRTMLCQTGPELIKAHTNHPTLDAVLNPNISECETSGWRVDCDPSGNCNSAPRGFENPLEVTGEWIQAINTWKAVENQTNTSYDPGSETSHRSMMHCNKNGGDMMARGGF